MRRGTCLQSIFFLGNPPNDSTKNKYFRDKIVIQMPAPSPFLVVKVVKLDFSTLV